MLSLAEALERAEAELAHDTELLGTLIVAGPGLETPNFWVFDPNSERAFETGESADSLSYRIPPVVVNRWSGTVTRPAGPGTQVQASDLSPTNGSFCSRSGRGSTSRPTACRSATS